MRPNGRLEDFLAEHVVTTEGMCSCGWDIANYDIEPYGWEEDDKPARRRAWIAHVRRVWRGAHPLGKIQQAAAIDPNGDEVVFDMEPGYDRLSEVPYHLGRYHGEYRYADYEPPPEPEGSLPMKGLTCEEAGCRDPDCYGGHFSFSLSFPQVCAGCGKEFAEGDERVGVMLRMPSGTPLEDGTPLASTATYHKGCEPPEEELRAHAEEMWPEPETDEPQEDDDELVQAAACVSCAVSWLFPDDLPEGTEDRFPLQSGPWENPCPECGGTIWITEPITRAELRRRDP